MSKRRGLGRGLDALLAGSKEPQPVNPEDRLTGSATNARTRPPGSGLAEVPLEQVFRGQFQPRRHFDEEALDELAQSIRSQGLMQPIILRSRAAGGYEIVAGERRWRAAQRAGLAVVPAVIREVDDEHAMAMALIENIQREDLNPLEEAVAMQRLRDEFELTQQQIADMLGKGRVSVANRLRLLNLAPATRLMLERGDLEMGHARALLSLDPPTQNALATEIVDKGMSVRQAEARVRSLLGAKNGKRTRTAATSRTKDADTRLLEQRLSEQLAAPVSIDSDLKGRGRLVISYASLEALEGILDHIR
jgi:ParB family chromosome partitioning protein